MKYESLLLDPRVVKLMEKHDMRRYSIAPVHMSWKEFENMDMWFAGEALHYLVFELDQNIYTFGDHKKLAYYNSNTAV